MEHGEIELPLDRVRAEAEAEGVVAPATLAVGGRVVGTVHGIGGAGADEGLVASVAFREDVELDRGDVFIAARRDGGLEVSEDDLLAGVEFRFVGRGGKSSAEERGGGGDGEAHFELVCEERAKLACMCGCKERIN